MNKASNNKTEKQNVGSSESQISIFSERIKNLTEHLKSNKKDHNTRRGLMKLVGKRKKLLSYVKTKSNERYTNSCSCRQHMSYANSIRRTKQKLL